MKKLLALAGIVAGVIGPFAPAALAHPHDHECNAEEEDENCYIEGPPRQECKTWHPNAAPISRCRHDGVVCTGTGTVTLSAGLYYVGVGPSVTASITSFTFFGTCALSATGSISGHCGNSTGTVTVNDGSESYTGSYVSAGGVLAFGGHNGGEITGVVHATPALGNSCVPGGAGADTFNLAGSVVLAS